MGGPKPGRQEKAMNRLYIALGALGVVGLGGLGVMLLTPKGRQTLRLAVEKMQFGSRRLEEWNQAAQDELERIQGALDELTQSLQPVNPETAAGS